MNIKEMLRHEINTIFCNPLHDKSKDNFEEIFKNNIKILNQYQNENYPNKSMEEIKNNLRIIYDKDRLSYDLLKKYKDLKSNRDCILEVLQKDMNLTENQRIFLSTSFLLKIENNIEYGKIKIEKDKENSFEKLSGPEKITCLNIWSVINN